MKPDPLQLPFREVWCCDFEFGALPGELPEPRCAVFRELRSGSLLRLWREDFSITPPVRLGPDSLFVAYYASAELGCFLRLDWPLPVNVLDLYAEFRWLISGLTPPCGHGLLGALACFGLDGMATNEKESLRQLALRGGDYSTAERTALLDYCQSDVDALARLLPTMLPRLDLPRALLRGRYMATVARMEACGVPIDLQGLEQLRQHWDALKEKLIARIDAGRGIYEGSSFRVDRWADYLARQGIGWPRLPSGQLALDDQTFRQMARCYPTQVGPFHELRYTLSQLRLNELAVGRDGRNRCLLSPFGAKTGRNTPSNSKFIFGPSVWLRGLIRPQPGMALAYIDYEQQEFGLAAALSGDAAMQAAYTSGDPYLAFAKQAGAVPDHATKSSHGPQREQFKNCALGVQYGMGPEALAQRLNAPLCRGRELLQLHRHTYPRYWSWSDQVELHALFRGKLVATFGWQVHTGDNLNPRSLRNFPLQANGAEMLRLACCRVTEQGIRVCAPVHDALLIEAPLDRIGQAVAGTQQIMAWASGMVTGSLILRTEAKLILPPDRYMDERGKTMWRTVWELIEELNATPRTIARGPLAPVHTPSSLMSCTREGITSQP